MPKQVNKEALRITQGNFIIRIRQYVASLLRRLKRTWLSDILSLPPIFHIILINLKRAAKCFWRYDHL